LATAKIKTDLVEAARAFMSSDGFKAEVIVAMPAEVVYSFESAMEEVLVSTEGFNTFKLQWIATYRNYARAWAKNDLSRTWALALESAANFVGREIEAGHDGQEIFDQRYRSEFVTHQGQIDKIRRIGYGFDLAAAKEVEELTKLIAKLDSVKTVVKTAHHKKPHSCEARGKHVGKPAKGGGKKRGVKGCKKKR